MAPISDSQLTDELLPKSSKRLALVPPDIADIIGIARRGSLYLVAGIILGFIAAYSILSMMPSVYKATSRIMFERTTTRYLQTNKVTNEPVIDDMDSYGQTYVIPSESIVLPVVRSLGLATDPTFVGEKDKKDLRAYVRDLLRTAAHAMGLPDKPTEDRFITDDEAEKIAADLILRNLQVMREDVPSVITISFYWKDPVKASQIVNAIVDTYMRSSIATKQRSTKIATELVQDRVDELKRQAADAERALVEYRMANNLANVARSGLSREQVTALQTHLTNARVAMAEAKARMERKEGSAQSSGIFGPDNDITTRLRAQLLDLGARANDIEGRVGKDHLAALKVRSRMEEVREAIAAEQKRISGAFGQDYVVAQARYDELAATIVATVGSEGANIETLARLRELEGAADTLRNLYNQMLQQVGDVIKLESPTTITPDARVLMRASPPSQTESSKKRLLVLAGGSMMGLLLGSALLFGRNFPFGVFRSAQQVTDATGLPCTILPRVSGRKKHVSLRSGEYALGAPYSRFAETLRNTWASINIAQRQSSAKVVCVLSSTPGEGKTTLAISLAAHGARHSSARVLVIDADFHRQSLTERITPDARVGLREALEEPEAFEKFVTKNDRLDLDTIPCPTSSRIPNSAELLGSVGMQKLIDAARKSYDLVVIEAPPMAAVVDYKMIEPHCDRFVFVVEWGKTSQRIMLECLDSAPEIFDRILCVILNKADPSALKSIEQYKGDRFHNYYSDQRT